jgi:hypothetical protein
VVLRVFSANMKVVGVSFNKCGRSIEINGIHVSGVRSNLKDF